MISTIIISAVKTFGIVMILMLIDLATGLFKATKTGVRIESGKLRSSVNKLIIYFIVMIIGGCLVYAGEDFIGGLFTVFLCLVEGISILENLTAIFPNSAFVAKLSKFLNHKLEEKIK